MMLDVFLQDAAFIADKLMGGRADVGNFLIPYYHSKPLIIALFCMTNCYVSQAPYPFLIPIRALTLGTDLRHLIRSREPSPVTSVAVVKFSHTIPIQE